MNEGDLDQYQVMRDDQPMHDEKIHEDGYPDTFKPEKSGPRLVTSAAVAFVCISLLAGYSCLVFEFDIPSETSLVLGLIIMTASWKYRSKPGMLNGLFTCGVIMAGLSLLVSLMNWFV